MKAGARALGVAESYAERGSVEDVDSASTGAERDDVGDSPADSSAGRAARRGERSVLCGAVVRADRVVDGFAFGTCAVGGVDATEAVADLSARLGREDVRYLFCSGIAPAWFNVLDLRRLAATVDRPVLSISFESSPGLDCALAEQFDGDALERRLSTYWAQPARRRLDVNGEVVFVRSVGLDDDEADEVVRAFTPEGGRPEPLRVARLAARAARRWTDP